VKKKILLVEDDKSLGQTLAERLSKEKYFVHLSVSLKDAQTYLETHQPDLIILDVGLPDGNGFDFAKKFLQKEDCPPFIFLTALSGAEERLKGYELGADEFIPKPFHLRELLLRVSHVLQTHAKPKSQLKNILFNNYKIFFDKYEIITPKEEKIHLTKKECNLLLLLIQNKDKVISRDEILNQIWGEDQFPSNRTVDNCIVKLRQSLGEKGASAIQSVRGVGYKWTGEFTKID
jgi:DNA-binding response OmpR family regulator